MTQVTISSAIANISATTPVVTFAQVPTGSHRKLYLIVGMRNGAGNAAPPTAVSVGTIAMTRTAGQQTG